MTPEQSIAICQSLAAQCGVSANMAAQAAAYLQAADPAPLLSPVFTGTPTAPTAAANTNSAQLATTAYVDSLKGAALGVATLDASGYIPLAQMPPSVLGGVSYQGTWNATTNTPTITSSVGTNGYFYIVSVSGTTSINGTSSWAVGDWILYQSSGTKWVKISPTYTPVTGIALSSLATQAANTVVMNNTGGVASPTAVSITNVTAALNAMVGDSGTGGTKGLVPVPAAGTAAAGKYLKADGTWAVPPGSVSPGDLAAYALLAGPAFTGVPTSATAAVDTNSTQLATCAFVIAQAGSASPVMDGTATVGISTRFARQDHVHPTDTTRAATAALASYAPLSGPALTGTPTAPTAAGGTNSTQIATTAFVATALGSYLTSATAASTYLTIATAASTYAAITSPSFNGTPAAPTAAPGTNTTQLATTAFVAAAVAGISITAGSGISVSGATVSVNTNNALGIGAYAIINIGGTASPGTIAAGSTITGAGSGSGYAFCDSTGTTFIGVPNGQVWRNVSGVTLTNTGTPTGPGLFIRVS